MYIYYANICIYIHIHNIYIYIYICMYVCMSICLYSLYIYICLVVLLGQFVREEHTMKSISHIIKYIY